MKLFRSLFLVFLGVFGCGSSAPITTNHPEQPKIGDRCNPAQGESACAGAYPAATCDASSGRCVELTPCADGYPCLGYACIGADPDSLGYCARTCGGGLLCAPGWVCGADFAFRCTIP